MEKKLVIKLLKSMRPEKKELKDFDDKMTNAEIIEWTEQRQMNYERVIYDNVIKKLENSDDFEWIDTIMETK